MPLVCKILLVYLAGISLVAVVVTIADKSRARRHKWRVPEATLLTLSAPGRLGGHVRHHAVHPA